MKPARRPRKIRRSSQQLALAVTGALAAMIIALVLTARPAQVSSGPPTEVTVPIAAEDDMVFIPTPSRPIAKGEKLSAVTFSHVRWPRSRVNGEFISDLSSYQNAVAVTPLPKLLPIPVSAVSNDVLDVNAVVEGIPEGMRAITVKADAESAVEGWARAGNFVDVILIAQTKDSEVGLEAKVIAENVRILSAGRLAQATNTGVNAPEAPKTVTLLTTQEDALKIKAAATLGKLTFSLRGHGDVTPSSIMSVAQKSLVGGGRKVTSKEEDEYRGYAKDSDGRVFVLRNGTRWVRDLPSGEKLDPSTDVARGE